MMCRDACFFQRGCGVFLGVFWVVMGLSGHAQTPQLATLPLAVAPAPVPGYTVIVNTFFDLNKQMKYKEAADSLLNSNPSEIANTGMHEQLFTALDGLRQKFGDFKKFAPIVDKRLGNDVSYVYGLALYEKGAVRFEFIFARNDATWQLLSCSYSLNIAEELRALAGVPPQPVSAGAK